MSQDNPFLGLRRDKLSASPIKQGNVIAAGTTTMATVTGAGTYEEDGERSDLLPLGSNQVIFMPRYYSLLIQR